MRARVFGLGLVVETQARAGQHRLECQRQPQPFGDRPGHAPFAAGQPGLERAEAASGRAREPGRAADRLEVGHAVGEHEVEPGGRHAWTLGPGQIKVKT